VATCSLVSLWSLLDYVKKGFCLFAIIVELTTGHEICLLATKNGGREPLHAAAKETRQVRFYIPLRTFSGLSRY